LPADRAKPACRVTQDLLVLRWREFTYPTKQRALVSMVSQTSHRVVSFLHVPVILPTSCRTPR
jgi:hypothetical protein